MTDRKLRMDKKTKHGSKTLMHLLCRQLSKQNRNSVDKWKHETSITESVPIVDPCCTEKALKQL